MIHCFLVGIRGYLGFYACYCHLSVPVGSAWVEIFYFIEVLELGIEISKRIKTIVLVILFKRDLSYKILEYAD